MSTLKKTYFTFTLFQKQNSDQEKKLYLKRMGTYVVMEKKDLNSI